MINDPGKFTWVHSGLKYKMGAHGFIYAWVCDEWVRSNKTLEELEGKTIRRYQDFFTGIKSKR